jgi:hypothetical protein
MNEGLSRHDTLHAIGSVVAEHLFEAADAKTKDDPNAIQTRYNAAVEWLSAKQWRNRPIKPYENRTFNVQVTGGPRSTRGAGHGTSALNAGG